MPQPGSNDGQSPDVRGFAIDAFLLQVVKLRCLHITRFDVSRIVAPGYTV